MLVNQVFDNIVLLDTLIPWGLLRDQSAEKPRAEVYGKLTAEIISDSV